jgi:hypothetical protein
MRSILFIDVKGTEVGYTIKGFLRYGGFKKQIHQSRHADTCIANENYTLQT